MRGPLGVPVAMGFFSVSACACGAYLGVVSPSGPFGMPFAWPPLKGWCRGARSAVCMGQLLESMLLACCVRG